jgi:hypothetical protein
MRKLIVIPFALVALAGGVVVAWRRDPRIGTGFVNGLVNPFLVVRGLAGTGRSEIGILEHVGRRTGVRRLTPVHPEPTPDGFRIVVPLGARSHWARNVLAAGHCRLQLHDQVYELDEPVLVSAGRLGDIPTPVRIALGRAGLRYLVLHQFAVAPGALHSTSADMTVPAPGQPGPVVVDVHDTRDELASRLP